MIDSEQQPKWAEKLEEVRQYWIATSNKPHEAWNHDMLLMHRETLRKIFD
jgi:hypothetical protein